MKTTLKIGDTVEANPGKILFPPLVFKIEKFSTVAGQQMACGSYGCFPIHLIKKSRKKL